MLSCDGNKKHNVFDVRDPASIIVYTPEGVITFEQPKGIDIRPDRKYYITTKEDKEVLVIGGVLVVEPK
jgi:hypothetical protein